MHIKCNVYWDAEYFIILQHMYKNLRIVKCIFGFLVSFGFSDDLRSSSLQNANRLLNAKVFVCELFCYAFD